MAIKAVYQGQASDNQQKTAIEAITVRLCGCARDNFDSNANVMSYLVGRESVGKEIEQYMIMDQKALEEMFKLRERSDRPKSNIKPL